MSQCEDIFRAKNEEYGATWIVYRWGSLTDQLWMKIKRIRTIEESGAKIPDPVSIEYKALINYAIAFLIRLKNTDIITPPEKILDDIENIYSYSEEQILRLYKKEADEAFQLYRLKNHDYNNAWQDMSMQSITDLVIVKVLRMKNILKQSDISADIQNKIYKELDSQLFDIINYSIFALIIDKNRGGL